MEMLQVISPEAHTPLPSPLSGWWPLLLSSAIGGETRWTSKLWLQDSFILIKDKTLQLYFYPQTINISQLLLNP